MYCASYPNLFYCKQVPNSSHPSVCNVSSCQGLDRSSNKYGASRNRMHSDYEYESASLLYGHVNQPTQQQPPPPPPCNKRTPDEQPQQYNTCCSEGNSIDRCMQSSLPGLPYKHHSGKHYGLFYVFKFGAIDLALLPPCHSI